MMRPITAVTLGALALAAIGCSGSSTTTGTAATVPAVASTSIAPGNATTPSPTTASSPPATPADAVTSATADPTATDVTTDVTVTTDLASPPTARSAVMLPAATRIDSMSWPTADIGWVLAGESDSPQLLSTVDAGATWVAGGSPLGGSEVLGSQILFADADNGWIAGDQGIVSTHDAGATWSKVTMPNGTDGVAAISQAGGTVHAAYPDRGIRIASSPIDRDAFVAAPVVISFGAGPVLELSMSAGGPYGALIYNDRGFKGAAEIRDGAWVPWDLECPFENSRAVAGLSPHGDALTIACGPSGYGGPAPLLGADLSAGTLGWATIEPAGDETQRPSHAMFATATDARIRIVAFTDRDGRAEIVSSSDDGASWPHRYVLPDGTTPTVAAHLPDGSVLVATAPSGGLISHDGVTWAPVTTG